VQSSPLGSPTLIALVIANMIGAGVFTTSGFSLGDLGSPRLVLLAWLIGGGVAVCGAVSYGALIRLRPESGGEYLFLARGIHPLAGFIGGWISLLAGFTGAIAYAAITFVAYATPALVGTTAGRTVASLLIAGAALLHGVRLGAGTRAQNFGVAIKLAAIVAFVGYALIFGGAASWPGWSSLVAADEAPFSIATFALTLMWISFSYSGFNAAVYLAGEVPQGRKLVPRALLLGTLITVIVYLALNTVFVLAPAVEAVAFQQDVAAIAAAAIGGETLALAVRGLIALALVTSVTAMIMIGPRVYAKMADDGLFPAALRFTGEIPRTAIWLQAALAIVVVWLSGLRELLSYLGFTLGLGTAATVATVFVFRREAPDVHLPGYPYAPVIYIAATALFAALGATQSPVELGAAAATVATGCLCYLGLRRWHDRRPPTSEEA
jgi:APA family basic amino acid/polyamine antiporter